MAWTCENGHPANHGPHCDICGHDRPAEARASTDSTACAGNTHGHPCPLHGGISPMGHRGTFCAWHYRMLESLPQDHTFAEFEAFVLRHSTSCVGWMHWPVATLWDFVTGKLRALPEPHACAKGWPSCPFAAEPTRPALKARADLIADVTSKLSAR